MRENNKETPYLWWYDDPKQKNRRKVHVSILSPDAL